MIKSMADVRREYGGLSLDKDLNKMDPYLLFESWLNEVVKTDNYDPTSMLLSTQDESGWPDSRVVLLKGVEQEKFIFYTNYSSSKAKQIEANPKVALNFFWPFMARQLRIQGTVTKLSNTKNDDYFYSRPRLSQIAAIASPQSDVIDSRLFLEKKMNDLIEKYGQEPIVRPNDWGGYAVTPIKMEFWQGRDNRLHDRLLFEKSINDWKIKRLAP